MGEGTIVTNDRGSDAEVRERSTAHRHVRILGTRGVPAAHGGFETFAEHLSLFLVARGWSVTVYCQADGADGIAHDSWRGVDLVRIGTKRAGAVGTMAFDAKATRHAARTPGLTLLLGYNTAVFNVLTRLARRPMVINMDGIEWRRDKWSPAQRAWLRLNEWAGAKLGAALVADHPAIKQHLTGVAPAERIAVIPYEAERVDNADPAPLAALGLTPGRFGVVIARPEPENSFLEIVRAWSRRPRGQTLAVLGKLDPANAFHTALRQAAGPEILFPGAIYDQAAVRALRVHASAYLHGHRVGGTNPSLVEALACGSPVIAHDNVFNRWTAGPGARFFADEDALATILDTLLDDAPARAAMRAASHARHAEAFTPETVLGAYEALLARHLP